MTEHTPTPWHTGSADHTELVMGFRDNREVIIAETDPASDMAVAEADVALIVQAVNSHDDLQATISRLTAERDGLRKALEAVKAETINVMRSQEQRLDQIYETAYAALTPAVSDADA